MYFSYYFGNVWILLSYYLIRQYKEKYGDVRNRGVREVYTFILAICNAVIFLFWCFQIMFNSTSTDDLFLIQLEAYPYSQINLPLFVFTYLLNIFFLPMACCDRTASDDDIFDYMNLQYNYPTDALKLQLARHNLKRFPVDRFEQYLKERRRRVAEKPGGVETDEMALLEMESKYFVDAYLDEIYLKYDNAVRIEMDYMKCKRDLCLVRNLQYNYNRGNWCDYEKIRLSRAL